ncbi:MAG: hypothetical protein RJB39_10 [Candidatus Parcubacteria bacterium]|jgi:RsiW-degrading membrane proteinase PrsW (M82 family)
MPMNPITRRIRVRRGRRQLKHWTPRVAVGLALGIALAFCLDSIQGMRLLTPVYWTISGILLLVAIGHDIRRYRK